jgi:hypothetical protein
MAKKQVKYSSKDLLIKEFLLNLAKKQHEHADDWFAEKKLTGSWVFGSLNDNSLRHGSGYSNQLSESMVNIIYDNRIDSNILETQKHQIIEAAKYTLEQCDTPVKGSLNDFYESVYNEVTK